MGEDKIIRTEGNPFERDGKQYQDFVVQDSISGQEVIRRYVKGVSGDWEVSPIDKQRVNLAKKAAKTERGVDLVKHMNTFEGVVVNLSKKPECKVDFRGIRAMVAYLFDVSGSMDHLYMKRGGMSTMQRVVDRTVPFGIHFDDDASINAWAFSTSVKRLPDITLDNYSNYVEDEIVNGVGISGGTNYAPALKAVYDYYVNKVKATIPVFVMFQTDGDNWDKEETIEWVIKLAAENIFVQFIPTGNEKFAFIDKLDNIPVGERACDNTGKTIVADFDKMPDDVLYKSLLSDFVPWLSAYPEATKAWKANHPADAKPTKKKKWFGLFG